MTAGDRTSPRFPFPPFPDSWYAVAWSSDVRQGAAAPVRAFGKDLVAFRKADGTVHVLDAHCPHLGAHLGHGGRVVDDEIQCPFHGWRFASDGRCTAASGGRRLRDCKRLSHWTVRELHDRIWIWFSSSGASPSWSLPAVLLDSTHRWASGGRLDRSFSSHPQDIIENAVDPHHFLFIHGMSEVFDSDVAFDEHCITTRLRVRCSSERMGFPGFSFAGSITVKVYGMGLQTIHTVMGVQQLGIEVNTLVIEGITPREEGHASLLIDIHMARTLPPGGVWLARRAFLRAVTMDVDADIRIWAHRKYLSHPQLTSADGEIGPFRKWARRFYPAEGQPAELG